MRLDEILVTHLGQFGRYQALHYALVGIPIIFTAMHPVSWTFTGAILDHRCLQPVENGTAMYGKNITRYQHAFDPNIDTKCKRIANSSFWTTTNSAITFEPCLDGYAWDMSFMDQTAVSRWNLVCDKSIIRAVILSMYFIGQIFGSLILGTTSDRMGRKPVFVLAILIQASCGMVLAFVLHWGLFALFRFGVGFTHPGTFMLAIILGTEMVGPKYRVASSVSVGIFFAFGLIILGCLSYLLRDYRYMQLAISVPEFFLVGYWWLVPESARWLMSQNRYGEADKILAKVAKCNGRPPLPQNWYKNIEKETEPLTWKKGFVALFRNPNLRKRTLISFILWPTVAMAYFGLATNPSFMGGDDRLAFVIGGILEVPGLLFVLFTLNFFGRRFLTPFGFLLAGACLFLTLTVSENLPLVSLLLVLVGKSSLSAVFSLIYIMTPEHYPTLIRNTATGVCSAVARAGAIPASFLSMYVADRNPEIVAIIFGGLAIVAGMATLFLPETTGAPLMETIEEGEAFGRNQPFWMFGFQCKKIHNAPVSSSSLDSTTIRSTMKTASGFNHAIAKKSDF